MKPPVGLIEPSFEHRPAIELPEGWSYIALGDAGTWLSGGTPSKSRADYWDNGTVPWVSPKDMKVPYLATAQDKVTGKAFNSGGAKLIPPGTLLFVVRGMILAHTFPVGLTTAEVTFNQDIKALIPNDGVDARYLMRALQHEAMHILFAVKEATHGTLRLESDTLQPWPIPLPPLAEQRRIVEKVEALLDQVNAARDRLEKVPQILKRFRQSVLAAACSGKLTGLTADGEVPPHWTWATLDELAVPGGIFDGARDHGSGTRVEQNLRTKDYTDSGVRVIRLENLAHLQFIHEKHTYISEEKYAGLKQSTVEPGDVLFGSFIGDDVRVCVLPKLETKALSKADCFCVRVQEKLVLPDYVALQLGCRRTYDSLLELVHGATRPRISTPQLRTVRVPVCPIEEQHAIVAAVNKHFELVSTIERRLTDASTSVGDIIQAILAKAFRGELVPTEAELARAEGREYEPASALLERIREEREANGSKKGTRTKKQRKPRRT